MSFCVHEAVFCTALVEEGYKWTVERTLSDWSLWLLMCSWLLDREIIITVDCTDRSLILANICYVFMWQVKIGWQLDACRSQVYTCWVHLLSMWMCSSVWLRMLNCHGNALSHAARCSVIQGGTELTGLFNFLTEFTKICIKYYYYY